MRCPVQWVVFVVVFVFVLVCVFAFVSKDSFQVLAQCGGAVFVFVVGFVFACTENSITRCSHNVAGQSWRQLLPLDCLGATGDMMMAMVSKKILQLLHYNYCNTIGPTSQA